MLDFDPWPQHPALSSWKRPSGWISPTDGEISSCGFLALLLHPFPLFRFDFFPFLHVPPAIWYTHNLFPRLLKSSLPAIGFLLYTLFIFGEVDCFLSIFLLDVGIGLTALPQGHRLHLS